MVTINSCNIPTAATGKILQGAGVGTAPAFSTATYPATAGTSGKILISDGTNIISSTPTYPNSSATAGKIIISDGTNYVASTPTYPNTSGTSGKILISDGTNNIYSTPTYPNTSGSAGKIIISDGTNNIYSTPTYPNTSGTSGKVVVSDGTNNVYSTPTFPNASATSRKIIVSDGTNWVASTETWATPGTSGNILKSDGTNWTSAAAAPTGGSLVLLSSQNASASASISFTSVITSTYTKYLLVYDNVLKSDGSVLELVVSVDNGANYLATGYTGGLMYTGYNGTTFSNSNSTTYLPILAGSAGAGNINLFNLTRATIPIIRGYAHGGDNIQIIGGANSTTSGVNAIKVLPASGTITNGTFTLYGLATS